MKKLIQRTVGISKTFPTQYDKRDYMIDLAEEVGELAQAVLIVEKRKITNDPAKKRTVEDIADGLCDVMYDVIMLAERYGIELDEEYEEMLSRLEKRLEGGEFS